MSQGAVIGERYRVLNELGSGGMGRVYRALDLVSGRVVAVKSVKTALTYLEVPTRVERGGGGPARPVATGSNDDDTVRAALAHEFEVLSNLRHENIVGVADYGFDDLGQPYYAMELAEGAQPLPAAAASASFEEQAELMAQLLRGLDYLHWSGILHRDLKPSNVLVVGGKVKLLDFGIAVAVEHLDQERKGEFGGTLAYIAPEVLRGQPPSAASDLFGAGLVFFQMMTGHHPRSLASRQDLLRDILTKVVDGHLAGIPPAIEPVLTRLLDPSPTDRYQDARAVLEDLSAAVDAPIPVETVATRNSFLSSAPLVGRERELTTLKAHAKAALDGDGRAVLVGGPSGVGKSRLLEETRISAQIRGAIVLRGQAESARALPYGLWTDIARRLCLLAEPDDLEAGVLATVVPGVDSLLGRAIPAPPGLDPAATQSRIALVVRGLLARLKRPALLLLEDLHWAPKESLRLLSAVAAEVPTRALFVVGTFRDDEAPGLGSELPDFRAVTLGPLARDAVADFVTRVAGESLPEAQLDAMMARTQGNPFFVIETLRSMAGRAGDLRKLASVEIPESSAALQRLAQEQLRRVPPKHRPLLEVAAVAGREVDIDLLQTLEPQFDFEGWIGTCTQASLFEFRAGALRFAHDKVREGILEHLAEGRRSSVHRRIAEALEVRATGEDRLLPALAHHWGVAGEADKERDYAVRAGRWALETGACHEAVVYLRRALELPSPEVSAAPAQETGFTSREDLQVMLTEASFQLGRLEDVRRHGEAALATLGYRIPQSGLGWSMGVMGEFVTRFRQAYLPVSRISPEDRTAAYEALKVQERLLELFLYAEQPVQILWAGLRTINLGERLGDTPELARAYATMGVVMGSIPLPKVAMSWGDRARSLADTVDPEGTTQIYVTVRRGVYGIGAGHFERIEAETRDGLALAERLRDQRGRDECRIVLSKCLHYHSRFDAADEVAEALHASAIRRGDEQARGWGLLARTENAVRAGRHESVLNLFEELDAWIEEFAASTEKVCPVGMMALARARSGDMDAGLRLAERAEVLARTTNVGVYWTLSGLAGAAEVLAEAARRAGDRPSRTTVASLEAMVGALGKYARIFPIGRPAHLRARGWLLFAKGKRGPAREAWRNAARVAEGLGMPFDAGAAHADLARSADDAAGHEDAAAAARPFLEQAAARYELERLTSSS